MRAEALLAENLDKEALQTDTVQIKQILPDDPVIHRWQSTRTQFSDGKEVGDLVRRIFQAVRAVHRIGIDAVGEIGADGAGRGVLGVGGAHQIAVSGNGILAFQRLNHHRAGDHELDQRVEERTFALYRIKPFRLAAREVLHLRGKEDRKSEEHTSALQSLMRISYA